MFKRLLWLVIGAAFGFGLSFWLIRTVRDAAARVAPGRVGGDLADALRRLGTDLREAAREGRDAMRETEDRLRAELGGPAGGPPAGAR